MGDYKKYVGNNDVVESGVAILASQEEWFTIEIHGLIFSITSWSESSKPAITTESQKRNHILIKINTWQGGDLTFKFKVGTLNGRDLNLAVNLDVHYNYRIVTYTFSQPIKS